jgi:NADH-quinone oxidoreductase subunit L
MIHAATMVSAGVYLGIRIFPLITMGWAPGEPLTPAMNVLAVIGSFTALFAATIAVAQYDIKRVLAYSTISQLGYMIAALGVGAYVAAAFHLFTHAFFKALLFLGSGSVIHGVEHGALHTGEHVEAQDMRNMGGLRKKMPLTFWTFLIGGLALSGLPLVTAGFWSKDEILAGAFNSGHALVFWVLAVTALLTAFYTARQITLPFLTPARTKAAEHAQERARTMTTPLVILAVFAVAAGWVGIPHTFPGLGKIVPNLFEAFLGGMAGAEGHAAGAAEASYLPLAVSVLVSLGGLLAGYLVYRNYRAAGAEDPLGERLGFYWTWLQNRYYIDQFYHLAFVRTSQLISDVFTYRWMDKRVIDGFIEGVAKLALKFGSAIRRWIDVQIVNGLGDLIGKIVRGAGLELREVQTGRIQQYMLTALLLLVVVSAVFFYFMVLA